MKERTVRSLLWDITFRLVHRQSHLDEAVVNSLLNDSGQFEEKADFDEACRYDYSGRLFNFGKA
jgi:hypothetical protein